MVSGNDALTMMLWRFDENDDDDDDYYSTATHACTIVPHTRNIRYTDNIMRPINDVIFHLCLNQNKNDIHLIELFD